METLSWGSLTTGADQQAANFDGLSWTANDGTGAGSVVVNATLLAGSDVDSNADVNPTAVIYGGYTYTDSDLLNTGEVYNGGNYDGTASGSNSALVLRNLEVDNASGAGDTRTVSLKLDFSTNDPGSYLNGIENLNFWISGIDSSAGVDAVEILAYDLDGNLLPPGAITFPSTGSNVSVDNSTSSALLGSNGGAAGVNDSAGAAEISISGPVGHIVINYNNLSTGSQSIAISDLTFDTSPTTPACFVEGTRILTAYGESPVEALNAGDLVMTSGKGLQPIRWIGHRTFAAKGSLAPICIGKGVLGNVRDLLVSPAHRMAISDPQVEALFSEPAVLVPAKAMVDSDRVYKKTGGMVTYYHILLDTHEIIFAEGAASESMYLGEGDTCLEGFEKDAVEEVLRIFPQFNGHLPHSGAVACPVLNMAEATLLFS